MCEEGRTNGRMDGGKESLCLTHKATIWPELMWHNRFRARWLSSWANLKWICRLCKGNMISAFTILDHDKTRGRWPYIPALTRAMRNRHVMLYYLNYLNISLKMASEVIWPWIWNQQPWLPWYPCTYCLQQPPRPWRPPNNLGGHLTSDLKSATLITLVSMCTLPPTTSEAMVASKQPQRSNDLRLVISNLDYPGIHVHIASNGLRGHGGLQTTSEVIWPQIWHQ